MERTVHSADETVPESAWENEFWLAEQVIIQLRAKDPDAVPGGIITYGDLAEITEITLPYIADDGNEHHIPAVIGDFTNLIRFSVGYEKLGDSYYEPTNVFSPLLPELPEEAKYLTNLTVRLDCIYSSGYDENIIRTAGGGIPDPEFYAAVRNSVSYLLQDSSGGLVKDMNVSDLYVSRCGISSIKGISLLDFTGVYYIDLSCNMITDISELAKTKISGATVDLSFNQLNLSDQATAAAIEELERRGCNVITENQNTVNVTVYQDIIEPYSEITVGYIDFIPDGMDKDSLSVSVSDSAAARAFLRQNEITVIGFVPGDVTISVLYGGEAIWQGSITVEDPTAPLAPQLTLNISEWDPTYADVYCNSQISYGSTVYFRRKTDTAWRELSGGARLYENGTYEFVLENGYGYRSEVVQLEVSGIKRSLTAEDFTDQRIYDALVFYCNSNIYEGMKIDYLSLRLWGVERLEDLLKLDFTGSESTIDLSCNNISDISALGALGLKNRYINLEANRLDLTNPDTLRVIKQLEEAGCTVYLENQNTDTEYFEFFNGDVYAEAGDTENPVIYYGYYPSSDAGGLRFAAENGGIFEIVSVSDGRVELRMTGTLGKDRLLVYHGDRLLGSVSVVYYDYDIPTAVTVNVYKNMAGIAFDLGTEAYPSWLGGFYVRKSGEQEWTLTEMYFAEAVPAAGENVTYEFMYITNENINSPVTEFTLCNNGEFIYLTGGGEITLIACSDENGTGTLRVPREIGGYTVTEMARDALSNTGYSEIILPDTLEKLGSNAIPWSAQLLLLRDSLTAIDEYALPNIGDTFVICCSRDSAAHRFITENNIGCILWLTGETGDINGDGEVDIRDFVRLKKLASAAESAGTDGGDLNSDGFTDAYDIALLRKYFLSTVYSIIKS